MTDRPTHGPIAHVGDRVRTYDGPGTVTAVTACSFYGSPPMRNGARIPGPWDGLRYDVSLDNGSRNSFDRSRIRKA